VISLFFFEGGKYMRPDMGMPALGAQCQQCGKLHPPLKPGQICPMAGTKGSKGDVIEGLTEFYSTFNNIVRSNISKYKITDTKQMFKNLTMLITRYFETIDHNK
jgi:hypothetical protein